jgi:DNA polymerase-1
MKIAMIRIPDALVKARLQAKMMLQVHDELVLEAPKEELQEVVRVVCQVMEGAYPLSIPLSTDARWGLNWDEMNAVS